MRIASIAGPLEVGVEHWREIQLSRLDRANPPFFDPAHPHNVGDFYLTKIVDRLLCHDELVLIAPDDPPEAWEYVNETCDAVVLRGGNYLGPDWLVSRIGLATIERIRIPIAVAGVGIQDVEDGRVPFHPDEARAWQHISEHSGAIAVRGHRSREVLASIGIHNVAVTGCPTLFWRRRPELDIAPPHDREVSFTYRDSLYSLDPAPYEAQFRAVDIVRNRARSTRVIIQGEEIALQAHHVARRWGAEHVVSHSQGPHDLRHVRRSPLDPDRALAEVHDQLDRLASPSLVEWVARSTFFSWDIADYLDHLSRQGLVVGCRLHSNLLSLGHGIPTFFLTYDERTREITDLLGVPQCDLMDFGPSVDPFAADWSEVPDRYQACLSELRRFFEANGLSHRLPTGGRHEVMS